MANPPGWAPIPNKPNIEGGDGALPPFLHAGVHQLCPNRARKGHVDVSDEAPLQCRGLVARLHRGAPEKGATHTLLDYLCLKNPCQPQTRLVTGNPYKDLFLDEFVWVSGNWEFRASDNGLWSFPRRNDRLPDSKCFFAGSIILILVKFFMLILIFVSIVVQI